MLRHQPLSEKSETSANVRETESGDAELDHVDSSSSSDSTRVKINADRCFTATRFSTAKW